MYIKLSGDVHYHKDHLTLRTSEGSMTLIPFSSRKRSASKKNGQRKHADLLFSYLKKKAKSKKRGRATMVGDVEGKKMLNARLAKSNMSPKAVKIAPESKNKFTREIERYFHKDSAVVAERLNFAGITNVPAFYHRLKNSSDEIPAFAKYLSVAEQHIRKFIKAVERDIDNLPLVTATPKFPVAHGVSLAQAKSALHISFRKKAPPEPPRFPMRERTPHLPSSVDHTKKVTKVRDQLPRGTCVAHAVAAMLEYELIAGGSFNRSLDLSEQYLYWGCKQIDGRPKSMGTLIEYGVEVLKGGIAAQKIPGGICREKFWPYETRTIIGNESHNPPPQRALTAQKYKIANYKRVNPKSISKLKTALAEGHCVGLSVFTYHFWNTGSSRSDGTITLPIGGNERDAAHAICLVGYKDNDDTHTDGYFVFKNSWGTRWGVERRDQGFGHLPYRYVIREGIEAWTITL